MLSAPSRLTVQEHERAAFAFGRGEPLEFKRVVRAKAPPDLEAIATLSSLGR